MNIEEIGYISKTHGLKGEVQIKLTTNKEIDETGFTAVFLLTNGSQAPFFIEGMRWTEHGPLVKLEGVNNVEAAKKLIGKKVSANADILLESEEDESLVGYVVTDEEKGELGPVEDVIDTAAGEVMQLSLQGKEVLLPYNEDLVLEIDEENKRILYKAPPGLIDMYLNA